MFYRKYGNGNLPLIHEITYQYTQTMVCNNPNCKHKCLELKECPVT